MGTICILLGLILLIAFTGAGFLASNLVLSSEVYTTLLHINDPTMIYVVLVGVCAFIGLLICLSLVMNGLIYNRVCKNGAALKKIARH